MRSGRPAVSGEGVAPPENASAAGECPKARLIREAQMACVGSTEIIVSYEYTKIPSEEKQQSIYVGMHIDLLKAFVGEAMLGVERNGCTATIRLHCKGASCLEKLVIVLRHEYSASIPVSAMPLIGPAVEEIGRSTGAVFHIKGTVLFINGCLSAVEAGRRALVQRVGEGLVGRDTRAVWWLERGGAGGALDHCYQRIADFFRLSFLRAFHSSELEDILSAENAYLEVLEGRLRIRAESSAALHSAVSKITSIYNSINVIKSSARVGLRLGVPPAPLCIINESGSVYVVGPLASVGLVSSLGECESRILLDLETANFICGKKCGKTNRIAKTTNAVLQITRTDELALILVRGAGGPVHSALGLLAGEFPISAGFHVDEKHHRRIIGARGRTIQAIMRRHNVYVRFTNGGTNNVALKTPRRNKESLERIKAEILMLATGLAGPQEKGRAEDVPFSIPAARASLGLEQFPALSSLFCIAGERPDCWR